MLKSNLRERQVSHKNYGVGARGARSSRVLGHGKQDGAGGISTHDADVFGKAVTVDIGLSGRKRYGIDV
jgi:hypothetical protein